MYRCEKYGKKGPVL